MVWPAAGWAGDFDAVSESYTLAAHDVDGILFPVGEAFRLARQLDATLHLVRAARARAALERRPYVLPDDVSTLAVPVLAHRLLLSPDAVVAGWQAADVVREVLSDVRVPDPGR